MAEGNDKEFAIVDLYTSNGLWVAIVSKTWIETQGDVSTCVYPKTDGENKAKTHTTPGKAWLRYEFSIRHWFDNFKAAKRKLNVAERQSDLNTDNNEEEVEMGRGNRRKIPRKVYSPSRNDSSSGEDDSVDFVDSVLPAVPTGLGFEYSHSASMDSCFQHSQPINESFAHATDEDMFRSTPNLDRQLQSPVYLQSAAISQNSVSLQVYQPEHQSLITQGMSPNLDRQLQSPVYLQPAVVSQNPVVLQVYPPEHQVLNTVPLVPRIPPNSVPRLPPTNPVPRLPPTNPVSRLPPTNPVPRHPSTNPVPRYPPANPVPRTTNPVPRHQPTSDSETSFEVLVMRQFAAMAENDKVRAVTLNAIHVQLENIQGQPSGPAAATAVVSVQMPPFPITTIADLHLFEAHLKVAENFDELVRIVKTIGGKSLGDAIKRSWKKLISVEVRAECNWCGKLRKGVRKFKLEDTQIQLAVFKGIRSCSQFSKSTDTELEVETKMFFKHAPERSRELRNSTRNQRVDDEDEIGEGAELPGHPLRQIIGRRRVPPLPPRGNADD